MTFNPGTPIENRVLRGLDLEIPTGQFVTVIGSNGAGKSTFLNAVSGDLIVDRGSIEIDGADVTKRPAWQRADLVARVFQDPMAGTCESADDRGEHGARVQARRAPRLRLLAQPRPARAVPREARASSSSGSRTGWPTASACCRAASARR